MYLYIYIYMYMYTCVSIMISKKKLVFLYTSLLKQNWHEICFPVHAIGLIKNKQIIKS